MSGDGFEPGARNAATPGDGFERSARSAAIPAGGAGGTDATDPHLPGPEPYLRLAEIAEAELVACRENRPQDLAPYYEEAQRIVAMLPPRPPASAAEALHRAAGAQRQIEELLASRLVMAEGDLDHLRRGREAARAYATTAAALGS